VILGDASRRLVAVGAVQQMLYGSDSCLGVGADAFLKSITSAILHASGQHAQLVAYADPVELPNHLAVPVSLILNELIATWWMQQPRSNDGLPSGAALASSYPPSVTNRTKCAVPSADNPPS
jgi:hypothetical protein